MPSVDSNCCDDRTRWPLFRLSSYPTSQVDYLLRNVRTMQYKLPLILLVYDVSNLHTVMNFFLSKKINFSLFLSDFLYSSVCLSFRLTFSICLFVCLSACEWSRQGSIWLRNWFMFDCHGVVYNILAAWDYQIRNILFFIICICICVYILFSWRCVDVMRMTAKLAEMVMDVVIAASLLAVCLIGAVFRIIQSVMCSRLYCILSMRPSSCPFPSVILCWIQNMQPLLTFTLSVCLSV